MAKLFKEKVNALKALLNGNTEVFKEPKTHLVITRGDNGTYEVDKKVMNQEEYDQWLKSLDPRDSIIGWIEVRYRNGQDQYGNKAIEDKVSRPSVDAIQTQQEPKKKKRKKD